MTETPTGALSRRRVMVVDDEQVIANTLAIILNNADFEARGVFSGQKAVELLETFSPDVLIVDVIMPGITGIEVAIIVRDKLPGCQILLFLGQAATSDLLDETRSRGYEFEILVKPVHPIDVLEQLRE